jgi:hypothetical protein
MNRCAQSERAKQRAADESPHGTERSKHAAISSNVGEVCLRCNIDPLASAALESTRASYALSQASKQPARLTVARAHNLQAHRSRHGISLI